MTPILEELDREWSELATSPRARRALIRWSNSHAALVGQHDLADVMRARRKAADAPGLLLALAALAPNDELAARTLLQALLPGLVCMSSATASDDPAAMEEMVSLAWERIRTYPTTRHGSVAANVLLDVRKRYRKHRLIEAPTGSLQIDGEPADDGCSPEDEVLGRLLVEALADAQRDGVVSPGAMGVILRTRIGGERLAELAAEQNVEPQVLCQRRWRAERRLRSLPLAG